MNPAQIFAPFLGALVLEAVHWYELREKLSQKKYQALIRSPYYWVPTVAMIVLGGVATLYIFGDTGLPHLTVAGAAFPTILKKLIKALPTPALTYGEDDENTVSFRDYLAV